jgi:REP element-mobilizing transposase RayT
MAHRFYIWDQAKTHFLTITVELWIDLFTRKIYRDILIENLSYCRSKKGLNIYAYVIMSNHIHLIAGAREGYVLSDILRDFKSYTSKLIEEAIYTEAESRREWIVQLLKAEAYQKKQSFTLWQSNNHPVIIESEHRMESIMHYIHQNPVRAGWVQYPEEYVYSSAKNYAGKAGIMEIDIVPLYGYK